MKRLSVLGLVVVVLVGGIVFPSPAMADAQGANTSQPSAEGTFVETQFIVTVFENGSARWTQRYNQPLANETQIQQFHAYADRFNGEETPVYTDFKERAMGLVVGGTNATDRRMEAREFTRSARVVSQPSATGVVEMSFVWTNFTARDGERVVVGDAFENGLYLSPEMALELTAGPSLDLAWASVEPTPDASTNESGNTSASVTYFGEAQFAGGHPRMAFTPESSVMTDGSSAFGTVLPWVAGAFVVALVLGVVVVRRSGGLRRDRDDHGTTAATNTADVAVSAGTAPPETDEATPPVEPSVADEELLTDADRVSELLETNGGRMKQGAIVEETGWSKSKVSTVLSAMDEEGRISKLRVGRENIVSLAGHEPEAARSPFDDG